MQVTQGRKTGGRNIIPRPYFDPLVFAFCTKCKKVKKRAEFPKNRRNKSGIHRWCKSCNNAATYAYSHNPETRRHRLDGQAMHQRRKNGSLLTGPIKPRYREPKS